jgi:DNA-binding NtrC family response regulator
MTSPRVLVIERDPEHLDVLEGVLVDWGHSVARATSAEQALALVSSQTFELALLVDAGLPGGDGLEVLRRLKKHDAELEVVMIIAAPSIASAIEAVREGAFDCIATPLDLEELRLSVMRALERRALHEEIRALRSQLGDRFTAREMIGGSAAMRTLRAAIVSAAMSDTPVLVEGERGAGKALAAAMIHRASRRRGGPFIPIRCAGIPAGLFESDLPAEAHGGTIVVEDVGELPLAHQAQLLRLLAERRALPAADRRSSVDVRVIAATSRRLEDAVRAGRFRRDLFGRLCGARLPVPPLRERKDDLPALVSHFVRRGNRDFGRAVRGVSPEAMARLAAYDFPGNVGELERMIETAFACGAIREITPEHLTLSGGEPPPAAEALTLGVAAAERSLIEQALQAHGHDRERAARALGISPRTMYRRLAKYGLSRRARRAG